MKAYGNLNVNRTARGIWGKKDGDDYQSQRFRQSRETEFLIFEALDGRDPNNPCDWGDCDYCFPTPAPSE